MTKSATRETADIASVVGRKNAIINGNFDIWQRGTSQTADGYGSDDRWINGRAGSTQVVSRQAFALGQTDVPNNPKYYSRTVVSSVAGASNLVVKLQRIEGVETFAGTTATVSFWAKADASKNIVVELVQVFGTGGSPSAISFVSPITVSLTTSWVKHTVSIAIPSIASKVLGTNGNDYLVLHLWMDADSNYNARTNSLGHQSGTFEFSQVQMEAGSVATTFEPRSVGQELALCQRYFQKNYDKDVFAGASSINVNTNQGSWGRANTGIIGFTTHFPVTLRGAPTLVVYDKLGNSNKCTVHGVAAQIVNNFPINVSNVTTTSVMVRAYNVAGGAAGIAYMYTVDAEL